ncbi:hypothetical protein C9374_010635 [Naegleria lovaniensis]|uniref:DUF4116 domain-containing protein n=1 Tax=Naegleria lovaniensis TaxID=51637 RepID=A0AA88KG44_NAELO|nr:uncharacterized protein C9374_010635 [Naegleria lovaniensis]KAG2374616.1 hypothetical protein C9374_010635 [Naegleria lovaniensis]
MDKRIEYLRGVTERVSKWTQLRNMNEPQDLYQVFDRLENFRQVLTQEINVMSEFKDHPLFSNKRFENRNDSGFERCYEYIIKNALANYTCDRYEYYKNPLEQYVNNINYNPSLILSRAFLSTSENDKLKELIFTAVNNCDSDWKHFSSMVNDWFCKDKDFILSLIPKQADAFNCAEQSLRRDNEFIKKALQANRKVFQKLSYNDWNFVKEILIAFPDIVIPEQYRKIECVTELAKENLEILKQVPWAIAFNVYHNLNPKKTIPTFKLQEGCYNDQTAQYSSHLSHLNKRIDIRTWYFYSQASTSKYEITNGQEIGEKIWKYIFGDK